MANVLILSLVFRPDGVSTAQILGDLAADLTTLGHAVTVLTTMPHFNHDLVAEREQPIRWFWGPILQRSFYHDVTVYHVAMPRERRVFRKRLAGWVGYHVVSTVAGALLAKPEVILSISTPPLSGGVCAWLLGLFHRCDFIYNVKELYPDLAVALGAVRGPASIRALGALERFVYERARTVVVIGPAMYQRLLAKGVPAGKVEVIADSVDIEAFQPLPKDNAFSRRHGIHDRFTVTYAGNIGLAQGLGVIIEAANYLRDESSIHFMMVGGGVFKEELARRADELGLDNVTFVPYQPFSAMAEIYSASDVSLVPLAAGLGATAIPSKVYRSLIARRPIIAVADSDSEVFHIVRETGCGWCVAPGDAAGLAAAVRDAFERRPELPSLAQRGRDYVLAHHTREFIARKYDTLLRSTYENREP